MMLTYEEAKTYLIEQLSKDVKAHLAGDILSVGSGFDHLYLNLPRKNDPRLVQLYIALDFWDGWQDARNHDWMYYEGIKAEDWPELATTIIQDIKNEREITNEKILSHFDIELKPSMIQRVKKLFGVG